MAFKVKPGDEFKLPAATWNRHDEAVEYVQRNLMLGRGDKAPPVRSSPLFATVRNGSGADRRRGEVLEFNDFALDPDMADRAIWMVGGAVTMANGFCVLQDPIPDTECSEYCQVLGLAFAIINIVSASHEYASPKKDSYVLQSCFGGPVRILFKPSGTGEKTCAVLLTGDSTGLVKPVSDIAQGSPGDCKAWLNNADTGATVSLTALLDVTGGTLCTQWCQFVLPAECS